MGGAVSPIVSNPADMEAAMQNAGDVQEEAVSENATEPPDNDLIDFELFNIFAEWGYGNQVYCSLILWIFSYQSINASIFS